MDTGRNGGALICATRGAAGKVIWTGHRQFLAATEARPQQGAVLRYLGHKDGHLN
jgi:hypothetical protein